MLIRLYVLLFSFGRTPSIHYSPATFPVDITGHLKNNFKDPMVDFSHLTIVAKGDNIIVAKTRVDRKGNFHMSFYPGEEKSFDFFCVGAGKDTLLLRSVTDFESDVVEMSFYVPVRYKKNALGKAICPKCKKTDKVYPIRYTDAFVYKHRKTAAPIYRGQYQECCLPGVAGFYCDRDRVKF